MKLNGLTISAITYFVGDQVIDFLECPDGSIVFYTLSGNTGYVEFDIEGHGHIIINEEEIYVIESDLFEVFYMDTKGDMFKIYDYIDDMRITGNHKFKSKMFILILQETFNKILTGTDTNKKYDMFKVGTDVVKIYLN